jgi:hypothetical protein
VGECRGVVEEGTRVVGVGEGEVGEGGGEVGEVPIEVGAEDEAREGGGEGVHLVVEFARVEGEVGDKRRQVVLGIM